MTAKLKGPENHSGFSHQGVAYEPDATGHIDVPHEALDEAFSHGFSLAAEQTAPHDNGPAPVKLSKMNKDQLVAFGKDTLGLELDITKTAKLLIEEIEAAQAAETAA